MRICPGSYSITHVLPAYHWLERQQRTNFPYKYYKIWKRRGPWRTFSQFLASKVHTKLKVAACILKLMMSRHICSSGHPCANRSSFSPKGSGIRLHFANGLSDNYSAPLDVSLAFYLTFVFLSSHGPLRVESLIKVGRTYGFGFLTKVFWLTVSKYGNGTWMDSCPGILIGLRINVDVPSFQFEKNSVTEFNNFSDWYWLEGSDKSFLVRIYYCAVNEIIVLFFLFQINKFMINQFIKNSARI